jgi:hypothetical protein
MDIYPLRCISPTKRNVLMKADEEDVLNVFCFGGAAKYVWVLLYVMSNKRTKHGLQFLDSTEEIIIQGTVSL